MILNTIKGKKSFLLVNFLRDKRKNGSIIQRRIKMKKAPKVSTIKAFRLLVPGTGFEPARRFQRHHLKVVRLPISPPGRLARISDILFRFRFSNIFLFFVLQFSFQNVLLKLDQKVRMLLLTCFLFYCVQEIFVRHYSSNQHKCNFLKYFLWHIQKTCFFGSTNPACRQTGSPPGHLGLQMYFILSRQFGKLFLFLLPIA